MRPEKEFGPFFFVTRIIECYILKAFETMIKIYQKTIKDRGLREIDGFRVGSWLYLEKPTKEEIEQVADLLKLKASLLGDALDVHEVPRIEVAKDTVYIFTRVPYAESNQTITVPILIILGENFLVTVSERALPLFDDFVRSEIDFFTTQKTKFFIQLFSQIIQLYNQHLTGISRQVRGGGVGLENISNRDVIQLVVFEGVLNDFISALLPTSTILRNLLSGKSLKLYEEDRELVEDLLLGSEQLIESCQSNLRTIVNIREASSTIMTNNLNRVIKLLTALTVILSVPTMIASLYGMNVPLPGADEPQAFFFVIGATALISVILFVVFIKNRWF